MQALYLFLIGPAAWFAVAVFLVGLLVRFVALTRLARKKDPVIFNYLSAGYAARSIAVWLTPFIPRNFQKNPVLAWVSFAFHICLFISPIFLSAHVILAEEALGFGWFTLPDQAADIMAFVVLGGVAYFLYRRLTQPQVRYLNRPQDFLLLAVVAAPFLTGILAYHQVFDVLTVTVLHVAAGELMLILIPFTWLGHMILGPMIRGYMGSEFGAIRHTRDW